MKLNAKDFLTIQDFSKEELLKLISLSIDLKNNKDKYRDTLKNKKLGMIFEKSSTRTRVSFEVGIYELGGMGLFLSSRDIQLGRGEPLSDTAKVLSRYLDGIMIRAFKQSNVEEIAENASIPVINGLTDLLHPCQALADVMTILEKKDRLEGVNLTFIGDGNNVAHSLGIIASKIGMNFSIATPEKFEMDKQITKLIFENAKVSGGKINIVNDPVEAIQNADAVYTDVWTSMGQEDESNLRLKAFEGYQINRKLTKRAADDYIFMHCLPAHRGEEVETEVIDDPKRSVIFDESENRLHAQKAVMAVLMK